MNTVEQTTEAITDVWTGVLEGLSEAVEYTVEAVKGFIEQYRRGQLLAWLLGHGVPTGPAIWISKYYPKCLLPKFDLIGDDDET